MILFLTFCVIFVTLVLQGLTLPALIRRLNLTGAGSEKFEEIDARRIMIQAALRRLEESPDRKKPALKEVHDDVARHYRLRQGALERALGGGRVFSEQHDSSQRIERDLRDAERAAAVQLRDQDRISDEVLQRLLRELDLQDARPLASYPEENGLP
jgi:CPA1 family monovalent cation:H+ antiporter